MSNNLVATEEIRDALAATDEPQTVGWIATELAVSVSTVRRHLNTLVERGQASQALTSPGTRATRYHLTERGRRASNANEEL